MENPSSHVLSCFIIPILFSFVSIETSLLITALIENIMIHQQNDVKAEYYEYSSDETAGKLHTVEIAPPGGLLMELGQSSSQSSRTSESDTPNPVVLNIISSTEDAEELDGNDQIIAEVEQHREIVMPRSDTSEMRMSMQNMGTEAEAQMQDLKNGLKVSSLVISVSTTGILSFFAGYPKSSESTMTLGNKLLLKAGILSMCASLIFALVLLALSTNKAKFSGFNQTVRIIIWISTGLMTLALALHIVFYLHISTT